MKYPNYKDMALEVIETLCLKCEPSKALLESIYMYAHVARNRCESPHREWKDVLKKTWKEINER